MKNRELRNGLSSLFGEEFVQLEFFHAHIFTSREDYLIFLRMFVVELFGEINRMSLLAQEIADSLKDQETFLTTRRKMAEEIERTYNSKGFQKTGYVLNTEKRRILDILRGSQ